MATRGCIIELKKDVCKIGYLHYGAGFASEFIQKEYIDSKYLERIFELDREFDKRNGYTGVLYQEITDAETIERLHKYDMDAIDMDAEVFIFMYNPQIEMFAHFKTKSSFHKTKCII